MTTNNEGACAVPAKHKPLDQRQIIDLRELWKRMGMDLSRNDDAARLDEEPES